MQQSIAFSDEVQREDMEICNTVQRNLHSRAYHQGRFSAKREDGVHHFQLIISQSRCFGANECRIGLSLPKNSPILENRRNGAAFAGTRCSVVQ